MCVRECVKKRRRASADTTDPHSEASNMRLLHTIQGRTKGLKHTISFGGLNVKQAPLKASDDLPVRRDDAAILRLRRRCTVWFLCATSLRDSRHDAAVSHRVRHRQSLAFNLTET